MSCSFLREWTFLQSWEEISSEIVWTAKACCVLFFPFWLTSTLNHPMAIYSANEIRTFYLEFSSYNSCYNITEILLHQALKVMSIKYIKNSYNLQISDFMDLNKLNKSLKSKDRICFKCTHGVVLVVKINGESLKFRRL